MKYGQYKKIDNAIKARDNGTIWERWRYGRRLQCDPEMTTPKGNLHHGRLDWLAKRSRASGREIQRRNQCGRTYPQESQIRQVLADFATWDDLHRANFPPYPITEGERPYNPLETDELVQQQEAASKRAAEDSLYENGGLIPREFSDSDPLDELDRHADLVVELAARQSGQAHRLRAYVDDLIKAVDGNQDHKATIGEAKRALHGADDD